MTTTTRPPVVLDTTQIDSIVEILTRCDQFLRCHASHSVHTELADFRTDQGMHPTTATGAVIDGLGLDRPAATHPGRRRSPARRDPAGTHGGEHR